MFPSLNILRISPYVGKCSEQRFKGRVYGGGWGYRKGAGLTSLSFHRPGMQKDSRRSLPHRSKMRNSTNTQAGGERDVLGKRHVYAVNNTFTGSQQQTRRIQSRKEETGGGAWSEEDSPISSYLMAVPRLAFSSEKKTRFNSLHISLALKVCDEHVWCLPTKVKRSMWGRTQQIFPKLSLTFPHTLTEQTERERRGRSLDKVRSHTRERLIGGWNGGRDSLAVGLWFMLAWFW